MVRLFLLVFIWVLLSGFTDASNIDEIRIDTREITHTWEAVYTDRDFIIKNLGDHFAMCGPGSLKDCSSIVEIKKIEALLKAIKQPPLDHLNISLLGIDPKKLKANAEKELKKLKGLSCQGKRPYCNKKLLHKVFLDIYSDLEWVENFFERYYFRGWSDDSPFFKITVKDKKGKVVTLTSGIQQVFMIPWRIHIDGKEHLTYKPDIPIALYEMIPDSISVEVDQRKRKVVSLSGFKSRLKMDPYELMFDSMFMGPYEEVNREIDRRHSIQRLGKLYSFLVSHFNMGWSRVYEGDGTFNWRAGVSPKGIFPQIYLRASKELKAFDEDKLKVYISSLIDLTSRIRNVPWLSSEFEGKREWVRGIYVENFFVLKQKSPVEGLRSDIKPFLKKAIPIILYNGSKGSLFSQREKETSWYLFEDSSMLLYSWSSFVSRFDVEVGLPAEVPFVKSLKGKNLPAGKWAAWVNPDGTLRKLYIQDDDQPQ